MSFSVSEIIRNAEGANIPGNQPASHSTLRDDTIVRLHRAEAIACPDAVAERPRLANTLMRGEGDEADGKEHDTGPRGTQIRHGVRPLAELEAQEAGAGCEDEFEGD